MQMQFEQVVRAGRGKRLITNTVSLNFNPAEAPNTEKTITETEPFNGKVYLADRAMQLGLIDSIGYLSDAVDVASSIGNLSRPKVLRYKFRKSPFSQLMEASQNQPFGLNVKSMDDLQTPRMMMMWKAY